MRLLLGVGTVFFWAASTPAEIPALEEMSLDRWAKLREVERYQLQTAEKYYRQRDWKIAAAEYEKYLQLYEKSEAAPYAQLKWSLCHVRMRKAHTAIRDGFQSVIDYWPDSPEAIAARYFIGRTYKEMGEMAKAKKALRTLIEMHGDTLAAVYGMGELLEIAAVEGDRETQAALWKKLTFEVKRTREIEQLCAQASRKLAAYYFSNLAFEDGLKALATTYNQRELPQRVYEFVRAPLAELAENAETKTRAEKLAERVVAYLREHMPEDTSTPQQKAAAKNVWLRIAEIRAAAGANAKVAETYEQIFKIFGVDDETLGHLAAWYEATDRVEEARKTYRRYADKIAGLQQVALSHRRYKEFARMAEVYEELMGLDPQNRAYWKGQTAKAYEDAKKYEQAIKLYEELLKEEVKNADTWRWSLGMCLKGAKRYKEAIAQFRQCDNFPLNYKEMAACHRHLQQYDEALTLYYQIVGGDAKSAPWAMLQIGFTLEEAGRREQAIRAFREVCRQYPRDQHASVAHAHLQSKYKISVTYGGDIEH